MTKLNIHHRNSQPSTQLRKCNQSKGNSDWRTWITSSAKLSPGSRKIPDLESRIARLEEFEKWRVPTKIDFEQVVGSEKWQHHMGNLQSTLDLLERHKELANEIRDIVAKQVGR